MEKNIITNNPWPGPSSYQDPEKSQVPLKFCGRDAEQYDVARLIDNNLFVTLYGKSGTGKTSLLNAGVFPRLRKMRYVPVRIRLGEDARGISFQKCIITKVEQEISEKGSLTCTEIVPLPETELSEEYLWSYFARMRFVNHEGQVVFPVIVLDQFEEVLRDRRKDTETLLRQIYFLMDESHALGDRQLDDGNTYTYDFNFRFVVALREDELYRLEDVIDNNYLKDMKLCRFRLLNMTTQGAREAILIPGDGLFKEDEREEIADAIINISKNKEDERISAVVLSLVCFRIFTEYQRTEAPCVNLAIVSKVVKNDPFKRFYKEATRGLSDKEKAYLELNLVDVNKRRVSIPEEEFLKNVKGGRKLMEGDLRILQKSSTSVNDKNYIELIHDFFCEPLSKLKEKRERKLKRQKRLNIIAIVCAILVPFFFLFLAINDLYDKEAENIQLRNILEVYKLQTDSLKSSVVVSYDNDSVKVLGEKDYVVDGITYSKSISKRLIDDWKEKNKDLCYEKIRTMISGYDISSEMLSKDPCVVYLILNSKSLSTKEDKQSWFDLYLMMDEEQIYKLYDILYREAYKMAEIEYKYQKKNAEIKKKWRSE